MRNEKEKFSKQLASEVKEDFLRRQEERRQIEQQWNLNVNYLIGNQYCEVTPSGELDEEEKYYYWQNRNVFNHIAPIVETRIAKLGRVRPKMCVRASGSEDKDLKTAKITSNVLNSTCQRLGLDGLVAKATLWSEVLGCAFYKVTWNGNDGKIIGDLDGETIREGDVSISVVSPFEIYPDNLFCEDIEELRSIIHAKVMNVDDIYDRYGVKVLGGDVNVFKMDSVGGGIFGKQKQIDGVVHNSAIVIERYEKPSKKFPFGRVVTVAGDVLVDVCDLPYLNGNDEKRVFPFIKQESISQPANFFGAGVVERIIPLQRAYNAVKNRKHEFLNRLAMGVLTVEDGSVDTDELIEDGLSPGKVIVYRQGSNPPQMMNPGNVPVDFSYEEERLTNEFVSVSGVSEISRNSVIPDSVTSGVAMQVLLEQDETRLSTTAESIKRAIKLVAKHIIRLFKQFAKETRLMKIAGENNKAEVFYFNSSDLSSDDVIFETENEISTTPAQKKSQVLELLSTGLLSDSNGGMDERTKAKILEILGFGSLDNVNDLTNLHISRADEENLKMAKEYVNAEEYDNHNLHVLQHTRFLLSGEIEKTENHDEIKKRISEHMKEHKMFLQMKLDNSSKKNNGITDGGVTE